MSSPSSRVASKAGKSSRHVALLALPDAVVSTLAGIYDVMNARTVMGTPGVQAPAPFHVEIVGETVGPLDLVSGVPMTVNTCATPFTYMTGWLLALEAS